MIDRRPTIRGFSLIESVITMVLAGSVLVAALSTVSVSRWGQVRYQTDSRGHALAQSLMAEILPLAYADPNDTGSLGLETGESGLVRRLWNDVDDFQGLQLSTLTDPNGVARPQTEGWTAAVSVTWANPANPMADEASDSGLKRIEVTTLYQARHRIRLMALKSEVTD